MIPANGHKIEPINPDKQDDIFEVFKLWQQELKSEELPTDWLFVADMQSFELNPQLSVNRSISAERLALYL